MHIVIFDRPATGGAGAPSKLFEHDTGSGE
jgi:hypothetical protein